MKRFGRNALKNAGIMLLSTLLFILCSGLFYVTKLAGAVQHPELEEGGAAAMTNEYLEKETREGIKDYWTFAIFGVDSRDGNLGRGANADAQLIGTLDKNSGELRLVSVYRDTFLMNSVGNENYGKITEAYLRGGPVQNTAALNANLDLQVEDYISFSWKAAADAVDLLGGTEIALTEAEWTYINAFITETSAQSGVPSMPLDGPGLNHLDGVQTVAYCRLRLMDSDVHRTKRQRTVLKQLLEKAKQADAGTLLTLLETVLPQTASSITLEDATELVRQVGTLNISETAGFPFDSTEARLGRLGECLVPNTLESNTEQLHRFLYGNDSYRCSERVKEIDREILKQAVRN